MSTLDLRDAADGLADFARVAADLECYLDAVERHLNYATGSAKEVAPLRADVLALVAKADKLQAEVSGWARRSERGMAL